LKIHIWKIWNYGIYGYDEDYDEDYDDKYYRKHMY